MHGSPSTFPLHSVSMVNNNYCRLFVSQRRNVDVAINKALEFVGYFSSILVTGEKGSKEE